MKKFLFGFGIFILCYHLIVTIVGYKILGGNYIYEIALAKEAIWIIFATIFFLKHHKDRKSYFQKRKYPRIFFLITIAFAIGISFLQEKTIYSIIIGLKYDFHFLFIFLSSTFIGHFRPNDKKTNNLKTSPLQGEIKGGSKNQKDKKTSRFTGINYLRLLQYTIGILIIIGFVRQAQKIVYSDIMIEKFGYGPVGDFAFGEEPPVYYRTGPGGFPRLQGIFAGPNNYGYFLVIFLPLILLRRKPKKYKELLSLHPEKLLRFGLILLWLIAIARTISRTALIGATLAIIFFHKDQLKKISKQAKIIGFTSILVLLVGISIRKWGSTQQHITAKVQGILSVVNEPLGHGLGTAGPAIFHEGSILPENFFIQLMVDIGTVGFLMWIFIIFHMLIIQKRIYNYYKKHKGTDKEQVVFLQRNYLNLGRSCFLLMGLFLHVFEDSMVNYLFFIPYGILTGYLSKNITMPKKQTIISTLKEIKNKK